MLDQEIRYDPEQFKDLKVDIGLPLDLFERERILDVSNDGKKPKVLDLFAGAGGFSLGFKAAGFKVLGANEIDEWASDTIRHNFPDEKIISGSICDISDDVLKDNFGGVDIIIGGPPCQGFSIANATARRSDDPRNSLFREFIRAVQILKPKFILIENVAGLKTKKTKDGELYIDIIQHELSKLGFHTEIQILNSQDYGVPQIRPRLFIFGSKEKIFQAFPKPTHFAQGKNFSLFSNEREHLPLWPAMSDLPLIEAREGSQVLDYDTDPKNDLQTLLRAKSKMVFNHQAMRHSARLVSRFSQVAWGSSGSDVSGEHAARRRNSTETGKRYDQNNRRNHPDRPSHTLPASFYANFIHPFVNRNYTPREGARLQTFPDWYRFQGKPTVVSQKLLSREGRKGEMHLCQYNQIGNAVPPILAYRIAENIMRQI